MKRKREYLLSLDNAKSKRINPVQKGGKEKEREKKGFSHHHVSGILKHSNKNTLTTRCFQGSRSSMPSLLLGHPLVTQSIGESPRMARATSGSHFRSDGLGCNPQSMGGCRPAWPRYGRQGHRLASSPVDEDPVRRGFRREASYGHEPTWERRA